MRINPFFSRCECGTITGERCPGFDFVPVHVDYMPPSLRASHEAAGNAGVWPVNGSVRLALHPLCAAELVGEWCLPTQDLN
jgi:hypothetical protein